MSNLRIQILLAVFYLLNLSISYAAADDSERYSGNLSGDWSGNRTNLYNHGVEIIPIYRIDGMHNASGGIKKAGDVLGNFDIKLFFDGEKLYNVSGSKIFIYFIANHGGKLNKRVGSIMQVDNIEVQASAFKLYEAWISQDFIDGKFSILTGLHDLNSEFYVTESSGLFIHPTYGIGAEFASTGVNGPSIFPNTALAVSSKIQFNENIYLRSAVFNAVAGNPNKPKGTNIRLEKKDGALLVAEAGINSENGNYAVGLWKYSKKFDDYINKDDNGESLKKSSSGAYLLMEKILQEYSQDNNLALFFRIGSASKSVNPIDYSWSSGIVLTGPFNRSNESKLGIGLAQAHLSPKYRKSISDSNLKIRSRETAIELTYSDLLTPYLTVQPDLQYIFHPATAVDSDDKYLKNALVIGVKLVVTF